MTWQGVLGAGVTLQLLAAAILGATFGSVDEYSTEGPGFGGLFAGGIVLSLGWVMTLAGAVGWGVELGTKHLVAPPASAEARPTICPKCVTPLEEGATSCSRCGAPRPE